MIDPQLTRGDRLVGQVLGSKGSLPSIYTEIEVNYFLLRRLLGVRSDDKKQTKVAKLAKNEILMVNMCVRFSSFGGCIELTMIVHAQRLDFGGWTNHLGQGRSRSNS